MTAEVVDEGQRRDRRGRVSCPRERREQLLAEYQKSGMSQAAFARRAGVRYPTFAHWVQEARKKPCARAGAHFTEVRLATTAPAAVATPELSVTLPGGLVARGTAASELANLVRALLAGA